MNCYAIRHLTRYRYSQSVSESIMETRMHPRSDSNQHCLTFSLSVSPRCRVFTYRDHFGNNVHHFDIPSDHNQLVIVAESVVEQQPMRLPYPGEAGDRNTFRGDGYFNIDSGLSKSWKIREYGNLKFAWEVYNVTNSVRFDAAYINTGLTGGQLGVATRTLTVPRRMQFGLRFDF